MVGNNGTSRRLSSAFLVAAILLLVVGLYLFIFADSVATLPASNHAANPWPWAIGPLALRFVASLVFAAAVVCYLVSRRTDPPTVATFGRVLAIVSALLILHSLVNLGSISWDKPFSFVWLLVLAFSLVGGILLAMRGRGSGMPTRAQLPSTPRAAQVIALSISILTGLVGGAMLLFPDFSRERWPWDLANSTNVQLLGAIFLAVGLSAFLSYLQPSWYGYDLFYPAAGTFATIALVASFMHWNLFAAHPVASWLFVAVYVLGAVLGLYPYFRYALGLGLMPEARAS